MASAISSFGAQKGRSQQMELKHLPLMHLEHQRKHQKDWLREGGGHYLADTEVQPLDPKAISESMREALNDAGLRDNSFNGCGLRFHSWRVAAAEKQRASPRRRAGYKKLWRPRICETE